MVTVKMARKRESAMVPKKKKTEPLTIWEREGEKGEREESDDNNGSEYKIVLMYLITILIKNINNNPRPSSFRQTRDRNVDKRDCSLSWSSIVLIIIAQQHLYGRAIVARLLSL
jgi:hypothetical protein